MDHSPNLGNGPGLDDIAPAGGPGGPGLGGDYPPPPEPAKAPAPKSGKAAWPPMGLWALLLAGAAFLFSLIALWSGPDAAPGTVDDAKLQERLLQISDRIGLLEQAIAAQPDPAKLTAEIGELHRRLDAMAGQPKSAAVASTPAPKAKAEAVAKPQVKGEAAPKKITHTVRSGQTLSAISRRYGVSVADIKKWNKLRGNNILVGQKLIIYQTR